MEYCRYGATVQRKLVEKPIGKNIVIAAVPLKTVGEKVSYAVPCPKV
jgi:hypothetical protein